MHVSALMLALSLGAAESNVQIGQGFCPEARLKDCNLAEMEGVMRLSECAPQGSEPHRSPSHGNVCDPVLQSREFDSISEQSRRMQAEESKMFEVVGNHQFLLNVKCHGFRSTGATATPVED